MKNLVLFLACSFFLLGKSLSQTSNADTLVSSSGKTYRFDQYNWWLKSEKLSFPMAGKISRATDSTLIFISKKTSETIKVSVEEIEYLKKRKTQSIAKGVTFGVFLGGLAGFFVAKSGENGAFISDLVNVRVVGGVVGALAGAAVGGVIGGIKTKISINGDRTKFKQNFKDKIRLD